MRELFSSVKKYANSVGGVVDVKHTADLKYEKL